MEYTFGKQDYCTNLKGIAGKVSSARYAGHPKDYTIDSLTIYQHTYFQGTEEYAFNELSNLQNINGREQSVIITGTSSWSVYEKENFEGSSTCVKATGADKGHPTFYGEIRQLISFDSIKSLKRGC